MSQPQPLSALPERTEVVAKVRALLVELLNLESGDSIQETSLLVDDLKVHSLGMVDMVTLVEEAYEMRLASNTDLTAIKTVSDIADLILEHLERKRAA